MISAIALKFRLNPEKMKKQRMGIEANSLVLELEEDLKKRGYGVFPSIDNSGGLLPLEFIIYGTTNKMTKDEEVKRVEGDVKSRFLHTEIGKCYDYQLSYMGFERERKRTNH